MLGVVCKSAIPPCLPRRKILLSAGKVEIVEPGKSAVEGETTAGLGTPTAPALKH
jgi:hypothetical protein